jgi:hypothetical protein
MRHLLAEQGKLDRLKDYMRAVLERDTAARPSPSESEQAAAKEAMV